MLGKQFGKDQLLLVDAMGYSGNERENYFCGCLVGEMKGEKIGGTYGVFSMGPPKIHPPNWGWQGAKWKMTHLLLLCTC